MKNVFPAVIEHALTLADVSWQPLLRQALAALQQAHPAYLSQLQEGAFLPTEGRLFAAFAQPLERIEWILVGEGPYPRAASATGVCFMDGAVGSLWNPEGGLSKQVNRATSLRNWIKTLLVAAGACETEQLSPAVMAQCSRQALQPGSGISQTLAELQQGLHEAGFLLLNASLVFREDVPPPQEAKPWLCFLDSLL